MKVFQVHREVFYKVVVRIFFLVPDFIGIPYPNAATQLDILKSWAEAGFPYLKSLSSPYL